MASGNLTVAEQYLYAAANAERIRHGLQPLRWDEALFAAANGHVWEMADRKTISHQFEGEPDLSARGQEAGARFSYIAENVAEAPTAVVIQEEWMNSPEHRANLLSSRVDSIAIRVVRRDGTLYAVEDFDRSVARLSLTQQENRVAQVLESDAGVHILPSSGDARRTCAMDSGFAGDRRPMFVMRYTTADLSQLPSVLERKLASGRYSSVAVGACPTQDIGDFTAYNIAVLLYR